MITPSPPSKNRAGWTLLALALPLLGWLAQAGEPVPVEPAKFVLLHSVVEMIAVVVAMLVFVTGYRAIVSVGQGSLVLLGVAFLGVGLFDFLHALSYPGMADAVTPNSPQKALFFWLASRMLAAISLLIYAGFPDVPAVIGARRRWAVGLMLLLAGVLGACGLSWPDSMPALVIDELHVTPLKVGLEWLIIVVHAGTMWLLWRRRHSLVRECAKALGFTVALCVVSELVFIGQGFVGTDAAYLLGHLYKVSAYLYLFHAITNESLRRPLEHMAVQHLRERLVLSAAPDGVMWVDQGGQILLANPAMETLSGYGMTELVGQNVDLFLPQPMRAQHAQAMRGYFFAPHPRAMGSMDVKLMRQDGAVLPVDISLGHWEDDGKKYAIVYIRDLTERKRLEESLRRQATHDELTALPNRWLFRLQLQQALIHAKRSERHVAVLLLDLDDFKTVNDGFGHIVGDELLIQVSARLRGVLREEDTLARLGGDEFAVLLADLGSTDEAVGVAGKVIAAMDGAFRIRSHHLQTGFSIGLAFGPDDASDSEALMRYADMAMYQAKNAGRGGYACYSTQMDRRTHENMQLHVQLKDAIKYDKLRLFYQPQVEVQSGAIIGAEALLRWHDDVLGDVSPAQFIPVAESTGLILPLSDWVLETACQQIADWERAGTPMRVAVNFSAHQFRQKDLPNSVASALQRSGASAQWLEIEITESVAMSQPVQAREQIEALVALGCSVSLDDFGTGYSSLAYLKALPVSKLKIDRAFIQDIPHDLNDAVLCRTIITLAHSLGLTLVAEGVENDAQLAFLREHSCEAFQGWLFARAMPAQELTARLQADQQRKVFQSAVSGSSSPSREESKFLSFIPEETS